MNGSRFIEQGVQYERTDRGMEDGWIDGWTDGWTDGWMDRWEKG